MNRQTCMSRFSWYHYLYDVKLEINRETRPDTVTIVATRFELLQEETILKFVSNKESSQTNQYTHLAFQSNNCVHGEILTTEVVDNIDNGMLHPCILIKVETTHNETFIYLIHLLNQESDGIFKLRLEGGLNLERPISHESERFCIVNSTLISWVSCRSIYFIHFHPPHRPPMLLSCSLLAEADLITPNSKYLACGTVLNPDYSCEHSRIQDMLYIFTVPYASTGISSSNAHELVSTSRTKAVLIAISKDGSCTPKLMDGSYFVPDVYGNLISCMKIMTIVQLNDNHLESDTRLSNTILAYTVVGQVLYFENGNLMKCVQTGMTCMTEPSMFSFENCVGRTYYVVACPIAVAVIEASSFQVEHILTTGGRVFFADFVNNAGDQMLVVTEEELQLSPVEWSKFTITDFHTCNIRMIQSQKNLMHSSDGESIQPAVQALEGRFHASINYVHGVERQFQDKLQLVEDTFSTLEQINSGKEKTVMRQHGLISLLGSDTLTDVDIDAWHLPVTASDMWHKTFGVDWVIGFTLSNISQSLLEPVKVAIIGQENQPIKATTFFTECCTDQHIVRHICDDAAPVPKIARFDVRLNERKLETECRLEPAGTIQVLVKTRVPVFSSLDNLNVAISVSWMNSACGAQQCGKKGGQRKGVNKCKTDGRGPHQSLVVGSVHISAKEVVNGTLQIQPADTLEDNDILVMDAVQIHFKLTVKSTNTVLTNFESRLKLGLQLVWLVKPDCWMCISQSALQNIRVKILQQVQPKDQNIDVHVRDKNQLFLFVHALYSILPDDAIVLQRHDNITNFTSTVLSAIIAETDFIKGSKWTLQHSDSAGNSSQQTEDKNVRTELNALRNEFSQNREQLLSRQNVHFDKDRLEQFSAHLHELEMKTDLTVQALANRLNDAC